MGFAHRGPRVAKPRLGGVFSVAGNLVGPSVQPGTCGAGRVGGGDRGRWGGTAQAALTQSHMPQDLMGRSPQPLAGGMLFVVLTQKCAIPCGLRKYAHSTLRRGAGGRRPFARQGLAHRRAGRAGQVRSTGLFRLAPACFKSWEIQLASHFPAPRHPGPDHGGSNDGKRREDHPDGRRF